MSRSANSFDPSEPRKPELAANYRFPVSKSPMSGTVPVSCNQSMACTVTELTFYSNRPVCYLGHGLLWISHAHKTTAVELVRCMVVDRSHESYERFEQRISHRSIIQFESLVFSPVLT